MVTAAQCGNCGKAGPEDDWIQISIEASAGPRSDRRMALTPTLTPDFNLCGTCWQAPEATTLRAIVMSEWTVVTPGLHGCVVICTRPRKRWKLTTATAGRWRTRTGRNPPDAWCKCPECLGKARVQHVGPVIPSTIKKLLTVTRRET